MWTFDVPPLEYWARRYSFRPTQDWLDHARLAALRQPGCTASFVSGDGLIMTNHHCARACIESSTRSGEDLLENGFYARARTDERACANYWVDQLLNITDVTDSVNSAVPAGSSPTQAADHRQQKIHELETGCSAGAPDLNCQVVVMYRGGQYKLYRFRRFSDIRLVFAPEDKMAFFGGDPDNFTYPRYDVDMSFYRAYVNGEPAHTDFFRFSRTGASEGDLVFVVGNPGSTGRLNTMSQLEFLRDVQYPAQLATLTRQIAIYHSFDTDPARSPGLRNTLFGLENSLKAITGYQAGLLDPQLMARKQTWENNFRNRVQSDAGLRRQYGDAWTSIQTVRRTIASLDVHRRYYGFGAYGSRLLAIASLLVRAPAELAKPAAERLGPFRSAGHVDTLVTLAVPIDTVVESRMLTAYLGAMASELPATDPLVRSVIGSKSPEEAARAMVRASTIVTNEQRAALRRGGAGALAGSRDPFIAMAKLIDPQEREISHQMSELTNQEAQNDERIARALLAVFGTGVAPDATFSLRISDGEIRRYPYNGTVAPPFTTFYGMFDRSAGFGNKAPWLLPPRWLAHRDSLILATPLNAVGTNDIIGGNSGSPVISRDGEIVGLIFDGNIEGLPARFLFTEARGRSVWVDSRGILESLRHVYDAGALADELAGR
ncbi:MAG TPA: S46 family peptidase [Gemmatimonadales bacterium]